MTEALDPAIIAGERKYSRRLKDYRAWQKSADLKTVEAAYGDAWEAGWDAALQAQSPNPGPAEARLLMTEDMLVAGCHAYEAWAANPGDDPTLSHGVRAVYLAMLAASKPQPLDGK